ncbi:MAG: hypothetical protein ACRDFX_03155 [Chloroflexota bacterium]
MTIAISLKVNDGVVLAADSASTVVTQNPDGSAGVVNIYNNANKVFNIVKGLPIGAVTWGAGSIGNASISTLMKDFRELLASSSVSDRGRFDPNTYSVSEVAQRLRTFMLDEQYVRTFDTWTEKPLLGFIVAGYSANGHMAEEYRLQAADGVCTGPTRVRGDEETGVAWSGQGDAIQRLLLGFGTQLPVVLKENLAVPEGQVGPAIQVIEEALNLPLVIPAMPLQDAIDLARFLVKLTMNVSRFSPGAPTVGGPIEIAAISKHEQFKWIARKHYYGRNYNPERDDDLPHAGQSESRGGAHGSE